MTYSFSPEAQELSVNEYLEQDWWLQNNEVPWQAIETAYISGIEATLKRFGL